MTFGRRETGVALSASMGRSDRSAPPREASDAIVARRGGYWAGLLAAALGFGGSAALAVAYDLTTAGPNDLTPLGLLQLTLVRVGPPALATYAISLALVDAMLRTFRASGRLLYAGLCPILPALLLVLPAWVARPAPHPIYYAALILPGAVAGGWILGGFRHRGDRAG